MSEVKTIIEAPISSTLLRNYFRNLVNQFFKILPMRESEESSLCVYMKSLQVELIGCKEFIPDIRENSSYLSLLAILQYLISNPSASISEVRREVFKAISICNKLKAIYAQVEVSQ